MIFGTVHQIQGAAKATWEKIEDPIYSKLVNYFLKGKDFVFEEASQLGPTIAEGVTRERFGDGHYLDIDPHKNDRWAYGIGDTGENFAADPCAAFTDFYYHEFNGEHLKRESLWLGRIRDTTFANGLLICGYLHTLSMASKLRSENFVVETWTYVPYSKLCPRPHAPSEIT